MATEKKKSEHNLYWSSSSSPADGLVHDLNNVLTAIVFSAGLINQGLSKDSPLRVFTEDILTASKKASSLAKQMVVSPDDISRNED